MCHIGNPHHWKILVIDDEPDIREVLEMTLQDSGYQVWSAENGEAGLIKCNQLTPQLLITDIRMPGMDGLQLLEVVKKRHPNIQAIVMTAFAEMDLAVKALQLDASDFITKPINDAALHMALKRAMERYEARQRLAEHTALLEQEKAQTDQELIKTLAFQRNLIESSMDGIMGCDETGKVVIFNKCMEQMLGYGRAEVLQRMSLQQFFPQEERARFAAALVEKRYGGAGKLMLFESLLIRKDQSTIPVQTSAATLPESGDAHGTVCFFRDLREIRRLEQDMADQARILHQDKIISLGRLAASVVHEINNPLTGVLNYIRLMIRVLERGPLDTVRQEKFSTYLRLVETEVARCAGIVSNLLTFSRKSPPAMSAVRIADLFEKSISLSRHKMELQHIELVTGVDDQLPTIRGDFNQLQQCLLNLIFNAVDAMPRGGILEMDGRLQQDSGSVMIRVKDTGSGIRPEDLPHVFEPFYTTKTEGYGVGLGLSTVYGIVERHGGSIVVESAPGKGTCFTLSFPTHTMGRPDSGYDPF